MSRRMIRVVSAVIETDGHYLITQRQASAVMPLLWEFPGGRIEDGETDEAALQREIRYRIGVDVQVGKCLAEHSHAYSTYDVHMTTYACTIPDGTVPYPANVNDMRWVKSREFLDYAFPPADELSVSKLLGLLGN